MPEQDPLAYIILFWSLPVLGVLAYVIVCRRMAVATTAPPYLPLFFIFWAYGTVLLFAVSAVFGEWSCGHFLMGFGLVFFGTPWLLWQSMMLRREPPLSTYHWFVIRAGNYFPAVLGGLVIFMFAAAGVHSALTK